jgi:hypothetical protein
MTHITAFCSRCEKKEEVVSMDIDDKGISMKLVCGYTVREEFRP